MCVQGLKPAFLCVLTYLLLIAPPWSQSHGLQPSMSFDRPQCSGCLYKKKTDEFYSYRRWNDPHWMWLCVWSRTRHSSQLWPVTSRLQKHCPVSESQEFPPGIVPRMLQEQAAKKYNETIQQHVFVFSHFPSKCPLWFNEYDRKNRNVEPTQAPIWPLSQSVVSLSAVVTALSLHIEFTPALTRDQPGRHISPRVTQSALQRSLRVTVTRCKDTNNYVKMIWRVETNGL